MHTSCINTRTRTTIRVSLAPFFIVSLLIRATIEFSLSLSLSSLSLLFSILFPSSTPLTYGSGNAEDSRTQCDVIGSHRMLRIGRFPWFVNLSCPTLADPRRSLFQPVIYTDLQEASFQWNCLDLCSVQIHILQRVQYKNGGRKNSILAENYFHSEKSTVLWVFFFQIVQFSQSDYSNTDRLF